MVKEPAAVIVVDLVGSFVLPAVSLVDQLLAKDDVAAEALDI